MAGSGITSSIISVPRRESDRLGSMGRDDEPDCVDAVVCCADTAAGWSVD